MHARSATVGSTSETICRLYGHHEGAAGGVGGPVGSTGNTGEYGE